MSKDTPLATALRVLRETRSMTQKELAAESGIERNTISKYENGWITPSRDKLRAMLAALGFGYDELEQAEGFVAALRQGGGPRLATAITEIRETPRPDLRQLAEELGRVLGLLIERLVGALHASDSEGAGPRSDDRGEDIEEG